jgi:hypothetical protein
MKAQDKGTSKNLLCVLCAFFEIFAVKNFTAKGAKKRASPKRKLKVFLEVPAIVEKQSGLTSLPWRNRLNSMKHNCLERLNVSTR